MNKHLVSVKKMLELKKASIQNKMKASIADDVKQSLTDALAEIESGLADLEAADGEATIEQIVGLFSNAIEKLSKAGEAVDVEVEAMKKDVEANLTKLQAQIQKGNNSKKRVSASMDMKKTMGQKADSYVPFHAAVDMSAWTPESEIDNVETFHPLIGVVGGFDVASTSKPSMKVRKLSATGTATAVVNHAPKPVIEVVGAQNLVAASTLAGVIEGIADEDLEDNPELAVELQNEALENLAQAENTSAIAVLEAAGQAFNHVAFGKVFYADNRTAVLAVVDQVRAALGNRPSPICFAANSSTWAKLKDLRNSNGTPIPLETVLGDVIAIEDNAITGTNFYCYAKKYAKLRIYKGAQQDWYKGVKFTESGGNITSVYSEWRTDEQSIRVRERIMMYVADNSTVVKGDLVVVAASLQTPAPPTDAQKVAIAKLTVLGLGLAWSVDQAGTILAANTAIATKTYPAGVTVVAAAGAGADSAKVVITITSGSETDKTIKLAGA